MITDAANKLAEEILKQANQHRDAARLYAVSYAESDNPVDKAAFQKYSMLEDQFRKMHSLVCQGLHATEAEMKKKLSSQEDTHE